MKLSRILKTKLFPVILLSLSWLGMMAHAHAQAPTGTITGVIQDSTQAAIAGASVIAYW